MSENVNAVYRKQGFTLIEIIAVLVLVGILATGGTYAISKAIEAYMFTRDNTAMSQKTQTALSRMMLDFTYIDTAATAALASSSNSFTYSGNYPQFPQTGVVNTENHTISMNGETLSYDGVTLLDNVVGGSLSFSYRNTYGGADAGSFSAATTIVGVSFSITAANGHQVDYAMRTVVDKISP